MIGRSPDSYSLLYFLFYLLHIIFIFITEELTFVFFFRLSFVLCIHVVWTVALVLTSLLSIMFVEILEPCRVFL